MHPELDVHDLSALRANVCVAKCRTREAYCRTSTYRGLLLRLGQEKMMAPDPNGENSNASVSEAGDGVDAVGQRLGLEQSPVPQLTGDHRSAGMR